MASGPVKDLAVTDLATLVAGKRAVFLDFYASWCGPCRAMEPIVDRLALRFAGRAEFVKINIDQSNGAALQYDVRGLPTFLLFAGGREIGRIVGATSEGALTIFLERHLDELQTAGEPSVG